jgi:hypothetical protein
MIAFILEIILEKHVFEQVLKALLDLCPQITKFSGKLITGG